MAAVHFDGSNNPLGISSASDKISFFPYFFIKDTLGLVAFLLFFSYFVYFSPNYLGQQVPESPFIEIGQIASIYYFAYFLLIVPILGRLEKSLQLA
jgi:ubiquinol-cytochrome c reductase cytochrome b subunit